MESIDVPNISPGVEIVEIESGMPLVG